MRRTTLACLMLFMVSTPAWAAKWEYLGQHPQGKMYLDLDSAKHEGHHVIYWAKRVFPKPQTALTKDFQYTEQHVRHDVDCAKRTVTFTGIAFYNGKKRVGGADRIKEGPKPIEAGGFISQEAKKLCKLSNKHAAAKPVAKAKSH